MVTKYFYYQELYKPLNTPEMYKPLHTIKYH